MFNIRSKRTCMGNGANEKWLICLIGGLKIVGGSRSMNWRTCQLINNLKYYCEVKTTIVTNSKYIAHTENYL